MGKLDQTYNIFAILALIFTFIFLPVGLIFGIISLNQIKKTKQLGSWMAWVPICFGIFFLLLILI